MDKLGRVSLVGLAIGFASVPLSIALLYTQWDLVAYDRTAAFARVQAWPWIRGGIALTAVSFLWPFYVNWLYRERPGQSADAVGLGCFVVTMVGTLLMYPGTSRLGVSSDGASPWPFLLIPLGQVIAAKCVAAGIAACERQTLMSQRDNLRLNEQGHR
jgi:hypothetical protein